MWEWLAELWASLTLARILITAGLFAVSAVLSLVIVGIVMVKIPENYFSSHYQHDFMPNSSWMTRWGAVIAKNIAGLILVIAGIIMLVGPGQGILTILIGLILMDIPGKRPIEARLIKRPIILAAVNNFRAKYDKPPLVMD
ncbi:MAG: PGPGW domain-containing protein [Acidobacteriota bacterium]